MGTRCADHVTPLYPQKLALTSPTGGVRSVGIVRVRTKATELVLIINPLTPNDPYRGCTAMLTSKVAFYIFIQQIPVLNILNVVYTVLFFSSKCILFHNSNVFGSCIIHILYTGCAKIKKSNYGTKRLMAFYGTSLYTVECFPGVTFMCTGLFEMIVGVSATCHTQYT